MVLREFSISIIQTSGSCKGAAVVSEGATGSRGRQRPPEGLQHSHCLPQLRRTRFYCAIRKRLERCCIAVPSENKGRLVQSASRRALFCVWILTSKVISEGGIAQRKGGSFLLITTALNLKI